MPKTEVMTEPSICIPRTLNNITWRDVKETFEEIVGRGTVDRVDIVASRNSDPFCKIFIHFRYWPTEGTAVQLRERLMNGDTLNVVYNAPWFWKCCASRLPKPTRQTIKTRPYVEFERSNAGDSLAATSVNAPEYSDA